MTVGGVPNLTKEALRANIYRVAAQRSGRYIDYPNISINNGTTLHFYYVVLEAETLLIVFKCKVVVYSWKGSRSCVLFSSCHYSNVWFNRQTCGHINNRLLFFTKHKRKFIVIYLRNTTFKLISLKNICWTPLIYERHNKLQIS